MEVNMDLFNKLPDEIIRQIFSFNINPICDLVRKKLKTDIVAFTIFQEEQYDPFNENDKRTIIRNEYIDMINKTLRITEDIPTNINYRIESGLRCPCFNCKNVCKRIYNNIEGYDGRQFCQLTEDVPS
jgi:hypothetical protein